MQHKHVWNLFAVICFHLHTLIALYRLDRNEKFLEVFAYPSYNCALYGVEPNL